MTCCVCGAATRVLKKLGCSTVTTTDEHSFFDADIYICVCCSHVQKKLSTDARRKLRALYRANYFSNKVGSHINVDKQGAVSSRNVDRVNAILRSLRFLKEDGLLHLDVGAGDGAFVSAFGQATQGRWLSHGYEVSASSRRLLKQAGCAKVFAAHLSKIPYRYDLITIFHVLEHVENPARLLRDVRSLLAPDGTVLVVVPTFSKVNPDFYIAEHLQHFSESTLNLIAKVSGFSLCAISDDVFSAVEIGFAGTATSDQEMLAIAALNYSSSLVSQLSSEIERRRKKILLFGVGGSGLWLGKLFREHIAAFVDEDPLKCGETFLGIPVIPIHEIEVNSTVFIALNNRGQSTLIAKRLSKRRPDVTFVVL